MKRCSSCGEEIQDSAIKCIHCGSFQGWRRFFGFSHVVLSLLVALVSVTSVTLPVVVDSFTPKNSNVLLSYLRSSNDHLSLMAMNRGVRPGVLRNAKLVIEGVGHELEILNGPVIVEQEAVLKVDVITQRVSDVYRVALEIDSSSQSHPRVESNCELVITSQDFRGAEHFSTFSRLCTEFLPGATLR